MAQQKGFRRTLLIATLLGLLAASVYFLFVPGLNTASKTTRIAIHRGMTFTAIVDELYRSGAIKSKWPALITGRIIPELHKIKPGRYVIAPGMSNFLLLYHLHSQKQDEVRVTLPEGLDLRHVASIMARKLDIDSTSFMAAVSDTRLLDKHGIKAKNAEGYLFPGTYDFAWASTSEEAAGFLISRFRKFYTGQLKTLTATSGLSETGLLTLASIVEAETPLDREKPIVASVYLNRLKKNMPLQADPTVQYALGGAARRLYYSDLATDSPYNTYRHKGLPPGPICNPGAQSILAVLNAANTGFLYFVATGTGGHNFASSLTEHNENIKKYHRARRQTIR